MRDELQISRETSVGLETTKDDLEQGMWIVRIGQLSGLQPSSTAALVHCDRLCASTRHFAGRGHEEGEGDTSAQNSG